MIPHDEILALRGEWGLREDVIEKDYVLGWLLAGIAAEPAVQDHWVFKGGTCLRKCYYETYRFSEDLDFTVIDGGPEEPSSLLPILGRISAWLRERCGLELEVSEGSLRRATNRRGMATTVARIAYRGPRNPPNLPKVKIDLTSDEVLVDTVHRRAIAHPYSDSSLVSMEAATYSIVELFGEKIRALAERCRPRDLYDVINMYRHPDLVGAPQSVRDVLIQKCAHADIEVPEATSILESPFRDELDQEWANMLDHQLPHLPPVGEYWAAVAPMFDWLEGAPVVPLPRAEIGRDIDVDWMPPRSMSTWGGRPLDLIRYAGFNRLKVDIDYRAGSGRSGWRRVEPYALRRTLDGNVILFVVNDRGQLRSYRTDRIADVQVTTEPFVPRHRVEF